MSFASVKTSSMAEASPGQVSWIANSTSTRIPFLQCATRRSSWWSTLMGHHHPWEATVARH